MYALPRPINPLRPEESHMKVQMYSGTSGRIRGANEMPNSKDIFVIADLRIEKPSSERAGGIKAPRR